MDDKELYKEIGSLVAGQKNLNTNIEAFSKQQSAQNQALKKDIENLKKEVEEIKVKWNKIGGGVLALLMLGSFFTWLISSISNIGAIIK